MYLKKSKINRLIQIKAIHFVVFAKNIDVNMFGLLLTNVPICYGNFLIGIHEDLDCVANRYYSKIDEN